MIDWDGDVASDQIFVWAGGTDDFDPQKAQRGFFAYDADKPNNQTSYKLPFCYIANGELVAVEKGILAVAQVLEGARGDVDLPATVKKQVREHVAAYYQRLNQEVPW